MPTTQALYSQNSSQNGTTIATAWPQVTPNGVGNQNLDLLQIAQLSSNRVLVAVDYLGNVIGPSSLVISQVTVSGSTAVYTGTFPNAGSNAYAGRRLNVQGFTNAGNNVTKAIITASSTTTITVSLANQVNETTAASANVYTAGTRVGRFSANLDQTATIAALFASAFSNPSQLDILQVINPGGNVHYSINYQGVASGS